MRILRIVALGMICVGAGLAAHGQSGGVVGENTAPSQTPKPVGPVRISSGVMAGLLLTKVDPLYPAGSQIQGVVTLHAIIGKDGHIEKLDAVAGPDEFRRSALKAVKQWTYRPYLLNGEPTEVDTVIVVNFNRS